MVLFVASYDSVSFFSLTLIFISSLLPFHFLFFSLPSPILYLQRQRAASRRRPVSGGKQVGKIGCRT